MLLLYEPGSPLRSSGSFLFHGVEHKYVPMLISATMLQNCRTVCRWIWKRLEIRISWRHEKETIVTPNTAAEFSSLKLLLNMRKWLQRCHLCQVWTWRILTERRAKNDTQGFSLLPTDFGKRFSLASQCDAARYGALTHIKCHPSH